jgi:hypothetical protein
MARTENANRNKSEIHMNSYLEPESQLTGLFIFINYKTQGPIECHWKDCKRLDPFSGKPSLMRHALILCQAKRKAGLQMRAKDPNIPETHTRDVPG